MRGQKGIPEAWGDADKNELFNQWHPEDFAAEGDKTMQNIYDWHAGKALEYQKQRKEQEKADSIKRAARELIDNHQLIPYLSNQVR